MTGFDSLKYVNKFIAEFFIRHLCTLLSSLILLSGMDSFFMMTYSGRRTPCKRGCLCQRWSRSEKLWSDSSVNYDYWKFLEGSSCRKRDSERRFKIAVYFVRDLLNDFLNLKSEIEDVRYSHSRSKWIEMVVKEKWDPSSLSVFLDSLKVMFSDPAKVSQLMVIFLL